MRVTAARRKEEKEKGKEGASSSASKVVEKGAPKRKADRKDDHPLKKVSVALGDKLPKRSSPPKLSHGVDKGLMTTSGPITQGSICRLLTHKEHAVEVIESIIKDTDVDPCVEQMMEELRTSGLFDLARVHLFFSFFLFIYLFIYCSIANGYFVYRRWSA